MLQQNTRVGGTQLWLSLPLRAGFNRNISDSEGLSEYRIDMAIQESATKDGEASNSSATEPKEAPDEENSAGWPSELFCECGSLREPLDASTKVCPNGCTTVSNEDLTVGELVFERPQQERRDLRIVNGDEIQKGPEYSRTKWCDSCAAERDVRAWVVQMRAADEPPTNKYECQQCGNRWNEHG